MAIRDRFENLDEVSKIEDGQLNHFANPELAINDVGTTIGAINCSIELVKRNGKPYDRLQVVFTALLETVTYLDEAQDEIDNLLNL